MIWKCYRLNVLRVNQLLMNISFSASLMILTFCIFLYTCTLLKYSLMSCTVICLSWNKISQCIMLCWWFILRVGNNACYDDHCIYLYRSHTKHRDWVYNQVTKHSDTGSTTKSQHTVTLSLHSSHKPQWDWVYTQVTRHIETGSTRQ